jgi:hypothetical protein
VACQRRFAELLTSWRTGCEHQVMVESSEWTAIQQVVDVPLFVERHSRDELAKLAS